MDFYASSNWFFYGNPISVYCGKGSETRCCVFNEPDRRCNLFIAGELSNLVIVTLIITTVLAEGVRKVGGYHNLKTTLFSHVIFSFGMFGNPLYIWVFPEYTVARATEEMSAEYATVMQNVAQIWMLPVMIAATVVLALVGSMLGKTVLKKQLSNAALI